MECEVCRRDFDTLETVTGSALVRPACRCGAKPPGAGTEVDRVCSACLQWVRGNAPVWSCPRCSLSGFWECEIPGLAGPCARCGEETDSAIVFTCCGDCGRRLERPTVLCRAHRRGFSAGLCLQCRARN